MRRSIYLIIYLITVILVPANVLAQENSTLRQVYTQAQNDYRIGRLNQAIELLQAHFKDFQGNLKQNACRLISLCYLAQDNIEQSEAYASLLINENPYYTSVQDPPRFEDMISRLKLSKGVMITTASSHEEKIAEAPVPVMIITREMIDNLSYNKSLNDILAAYVPGFTQVSTAGMDNVAVHGVYTSGQEKILVMEDGHRLNARSTNTGKMDYAISTEKIDHIEVLRGPASSLYGNVALTAVVNIITRKGDSVGGLKMKYGYAEHTTHKADVLYGNTVLGADVLVWASVYTSKGSSVFLPAGVGYNYSNKDGSVPVGRYDDKPSYDWGTNIQMKDFSIMLSRKYSKQVPQYTLYGETYDFPRYRMLNEQTPGLSIGSTNMELAYGKMFRGINFNFSVFGDWYHFADYTVISDSIIFTRYGTDGKQMTDADGNPIRELQKGLSQKTDWSEYTIGATAKADFTYKIGSMRGNLLMGSQFELFNMTNTDYFLGVNYDQIEFVMPESLNAIDIGKEQITSLFLQDKHNITDNIIINAGIRYDFKHRKNNKNIYSFSPRLAFVYTPATAFNVKLSYSRAFVDAPYFYRQNHTNTYSGGENLMPEYINALQLDFIGTLYKNYLTYDVNLFYNHLTDIINNTQKFGESTSAKYRNSGSLKNCGIEGVLGYSDQSTFGQLSMTYQHLLLAEDYYSSGSYIIAVPKFTANLNASRKLLRWGSHAIWVSANMHYNTKTRHQINERSNPTATVVDINDCLTLDLGIRYNYGNMIKVSFDAENLLDKTCYIGGTTHYPYQRLGRTTMATVSLNF